VQLPFLYIILSSDLFNMNSATPVQKVPAFTRSVPERPPRGGKRLVFEQPSLGDSAQPHRGKRPRHSHFEMPICPPRGGNRLVFEQPHREKRVCIERSQLRHFHLERFSLALTALPARGAPPTKALAASSRRVLQLPRASSTQVRQSAQDSNSIKIPVQLIQDYKQRSTATALFPPKISESCIRDCMSRFEDHVAAAIKAVEKICASCGRFTEKHVVELPKDHPLLVRFYAGPDSSPQLDSCALIGNNYLFCSRCFKAIRKGLPPKYSALNCVNVSFCQNYPGALQDLTVTEECLIARSHPIACVLKLRPNGAYNPAAYNRLRGHIVVLPQNPGPLLNILPSAELELHEKIKVVWFGDRLPTADDLKPYLEVRKQVVYQALQWLRLYNKLYSGIVVDEELLNSWADSFIPGELENSIVYSKDDREEREGYAADIGTENYENDLQEALGDQASDSISTGCIYSDVESTQQRPELKIVSTILNIEKERFEREAPANSRGESSTSRYIEDIPVIRYVSNGRSVLMNDWQDPEYFTGSFPILFPLGLGGHLSDCRERKVPVSLKSWAKWALTHHSRRYDSEF
jgi:Domain of unknown function (DUF6570)